MLKVVAILVGILALASGQTIPCEGGGEYICRNTMQGRQTECSTMARLAAMSPRVSRGPCPCTSQVSMIGDNSLASATYNYPKVLHEQAFGISSGFCLPTYKVTNWQEAVGTYAAVEEHDDSNNFDFVVEEILYTSAELYEDIRRDLGSDDTRFVANNGFSACMVHGSLHGIKAVIGVFTVEINLGRVLTFAFVLANDDYYMGEKERPKCFCCDLCQEYTERAIDLLDCAYEVEVDETCVTTAADYTITQGEYEYGLLYDAAEAIHKQERLILVKDVMARVAINQIRQLNDNFVRYRMSMFEQEFRYQTSEWADDVRLALVTREVAAWYAIDDEREEAEIAGIIEYQGKCDALIQQLSQQCMTCVLPPTESPSSAPSGVPTPQPTRTPSSEPTRAPSPEPTWNPSIIPSIVPTVVPETTAEIIEVIGCTLDAFFCDDDFNDIGPQTYIQGDILQACIVPVGNFSIQAIETATLSQDKNSDGLVDLSYDVVVATEPTDSFTTVTCSLGRCRIRTGLQRDFFTQQFPAIIQVTAEVICVQGSTPLVVACSDSLATVNEDSGFVTYPVYTSLNDLGNSDYVSVVIEYATPGTGNPPQLQFGTTAVGVNVVFGTGLVTVTGTNEGIIETMRTLQIAPGIDNGEDISYNVTATAINAEQQTLSMMDACVIPVKPLIDGSVSIVLDADGVGLEDEPIAIGGTVTYSGQLDADGSEQVYLEVLVSSVPVGSQFFVDGQNVTEQVGGYFRLPGDGTSQIEILGPLHFSGVVELQVRGSVIDTSSSDETRISTGRLPLFVTVGPVFDLFELPDPSEGIEDISDDINFGAIIEAGFLLEDDGTGTGNNVEPETITRITLKPPSDKGDLTYTFSGTYVPPNDGGSGARSGFGSASVSYVQSTETYTITSSLLDGFDLVDVSQADREQAEADIRETLKAFIVSLGRPEHSDDDGVIEVTVDSVDVNIGQASEQNGYSFEHPIVIQANADTPGVSVISPAATVDEDGDNIFLTIFATKSADVDNSETLSAVITVPSDEFGPIGTIEGNTPAGVTITDLGDGKFSIEATGATVDGREALLNSFLNGNVEFNPRDHVSGEFLAESGLRVDIVSTEAAEDPIQLAPGSVGGADGTAKTETVTDYIGFIINPVADIPEVQVKGNAIGYEDNLIAIPISITLAEIDGSETYTMQIIDNLPEGTKLFGASGELLPVDGFYDLTPADVSFLEMLPPLHWSSINPTQGLITLTTITTVTEIGATDPADLTFDVPTRVIGIADKPRNRPATVLGVEDEDLFIGLALGDLTDGILVDDDGSESLSVLISGVPAGIIPGYDAGTVTYLGGGRWVASLDAVPSLTLPPIENLSGDIGFYPDMILRVTSQELDLDQISSDPWPTSYAVTPVADGFAAWEMEFAITEGENEQGIGGVPLLSANNHTYIDDDGSETVISYTFDLSTLISDAGIGVHMTDNLGISTLQDIIDNYLSGTFTYDDTAGTITVLPEDLGGIVLSGDLFFDSNQDFNITVTALIRDTASIYGEIFTDDITQSGQFVVNLIGTADVPSVFAFNTVGLPGRYLPITLGGDTRDTDVALGRPQSEFVYYIVKLLNPRPRLEDYGFTDASGVVRGLDFGNNEWYLERSDLDGLHISTPGFTLDGDMEFRLRCVARETDFERDIAWNITFFTVTILPGEGCNNCDPPLPPILEVGPNIGVEDNSLVLVASATEDPADTTAPVISLIIQNVPDGARFDGLIRQNPGTGDWIADAADVISGGVYVDPFPDFSGTYVMDFLALAANQGGLTASSNVTTDGLYFDPVADGVVFTIIGDGAEDEIIPVSVSFVELDIDGSEEPGNITYVSLSDGATLIGDYPVVAVGDYDEVILGTELVGFSRVPTVDINELEVQGAPHWHGTITALFYILVIEPLDDEDADYAILSNATALIDVVAVADVPIISAENAAGDEDTAIPLTVSAELVDTEPANGPEVLSVIIAGVPDDSKFSAGSNNGDGSWLIPADALPTLTLTPPEHYAGLMSLTMTGIALELSNGDEATTSVDFEVDVTPIADFYLIVAQDVVMSPVGTAALDLAIRFLDIRGEEPGEFPPELVALTFTQVPSNIRVVANGGGEVVDNGDNSFTFTGTEEQSNNLGLVSAGAGAGRYRVYLSGVNIDQESVGEPVLDNFRLIVQ